MENIQEKIGWARALRLNLRAAKTLREMEPWFFPLQTADSAILALAPLVNLYMSALVLNMLAAGISELSEIFFLVALAVALNFAFAAIRSLTQRKLTTINRMLWRKHSIYMSARHMEMDFEHVEKREVNMALADINAKAQSTGAGLPAVTRDYGAIIQSLVGIGASLAILYGMFVGAAPVVANFLTSHWSTALLAAMFALLPLLSLYREKYMTRAHRLIAVEGPRINNTFEYYIPYMESAAKDIRIFAQQPAMNEIIEKRGNIKTWKRFFHTMGRESGITTFANDVLACAAYLLIGLRALWGMYEIGSAVAYVGAARGLSAGVSALVSAIMRVKVNAGFLPQVFDYLDLPKAKRSGTKRLKDCEHVVEFHNVFFKY
ncbi:MAG: hypothetical protein FWE09_00555, partial [Treponema sp.]|nr:hypothetical protein [Treponema sp.]